MNQDSRPMMQAQETGYLLHPPYGTRHTPITIDTTEWTHVCSARFGPGRPCSFSKSTKWTGDAYRYDIFIRPDDRYTALRWANGAGEGWLIAEDKCEREEGSLLKHIAEILPEARRWDYCHFLWAAVTQSQRAAVCTTDAAWEEAILNKKIQIRKRNGRRTASIKPQDLTVTNTSLPSPETMATTG